MSENEQLKAPTTAPPSGPSDALPRAVATRRSRLSVVWLIPLAALAVGGWLAYKTFSEQGPTIVIELASAAGLQAGKTKVKFKDVDVGQVTSIDVSPDLKSVMVSAQLTPGAAAYLTEGTRFWVERPRVTASRVTGLETLLSGAYIAIDPVEEGEPRRRFQGLEAPPLFTTSEPGSRFELRSSTLGSLNIGSPVYYRQIQVGQVVGYTLQEDGQGVSIELFISAPHDRLVYSGTRFWNASGLDFSISANGLRVDTQSLLSVLIGGVAFDTLDTIGGDRERARPGELFPLYPSREEAHEKVYAHKERYLMFFTGSVRGLSVGAPVLLRGLAIGQVLDVQLTFNTDDFEFQVPVLVEIEPDRIGVTGDRATLDSDRVLERLVKAGLRGQLKSGSLLTGQLYVDLDFHKEAPAATVSKFGEYDVVPTLAAPLDALTTKINDILDKVGEIPIEKIGQDVSETAAGANALVNSGELKQAIVEIESTLSEIRATAQQLNANIAPELTTTLKQTTSTMKSAESVIAENSPMYIELRRMFTELSAAARSVRVMAEYLERHPEALLKGKGGGR